jgi:hypothetical protein
MTMSEIENRLDALEKNVKKLLFSKKSSVAKQWWRAGAGRFADDPAFEEIVRLGRQHRKSTRKRTR